MNEEEDKYTVSVVIPVYNNAEFVSRAVDSVLAQSLPADEIIVVDDGSTDNTAEIIGAYGAQVKYIHQDNAGASVARNTGIKAASCDWIAFLDADDEWLPEKLHLQLEHLSRNPDLAWTTGNYIRCVCRQDMRAVHIKPQKSREILGGREYIDSFFSAFLQNVWGCTDTMLIKRAVLMEAGLFRPGQLRANDFDMWWRIAYHSPRIGFVAEPLAVYHLDVEASTIRKYRSAELFCELIERHLNISSEHGMAEKFTPCAALLIRRRMRSMLFEARGMDIRNTIRRFAELLPWYYKTIMWILTTFPRITAALCRAISRALKFMPVKRRLSRSRL